MLAGRCASLPTAPPAPARTPAENGSFLTSGGEFRRETDCLLERRGFELSVPLPKQNRTLRRKGRCRSGEESCLACVSAPKQAPCRIKTNTLIFHSEFGHRRGPRSALVRIHLPPAKRSQHEPEIRSAARAISSLIWLPCSRVRRGESDEPRTRRPSRPDPARDAVVTCGLRAAGAPLRRGRAPRSAVDRRRPTRPGAAPACFRDSRSPSG